jgi:quinol monooxygenase YgiN
MKNKIQFPFILTVIALSVLSIYSCKNAGDKAEATTPSDTTAMAETQMVASAPFKVFSVSHKVKDYDAFKKVYDEYESKRTEAGLTKLAVSRDMDDPNKVYVFNRIADLQKARDFAAGQGLKEAMQRAGVTDNPVMLFVDVIRFEESPAEYKNRLRVGHKVKDFDAWLKVYDGEGKETRAAHGLIERAISRNLDDPNMVYVTFAISDLAKAKTRVNDPALKKIMTDAGVVGAPEINFYTSVD